MKADIFAPNNQVYSTICSIASLLQIKCATVDGTLFLWLKNVKEVVEARLKLIKAANNLDTSGCFNGKIFLFFVGDKGGKSSKCSIGIGNISQANSLNNLLLVALYDGEDNYQKLLYLADVFEQLKFDSVKIGTVNYEVEWYA